MTKLKKLITLFALTLVFTSCAGTAADNDAKKIFEDEKEALEKRIAFQTPLKDEIKFGVVETVENLNPFYNEDESSKIITSMLYQNLFTIEESHHQEEFNYLLADSLTSSEDGTVYNLKLKDNLYWHNGDKITVDDIIFSIKYSYENKDTVYLNNFLVDGKEITMNKVSDTELEFILPKPSFTFKYSLESLKVVPAKTFKDAPKQFTFEDKNHLIGSGPYVFDEKVHDDYFNVDEFKFKAFDKYFEGLANIPKLSIKNVAHYSSTRYDMLDYNIQGGYILGNDVGAFVDDFYNINTVEAGNVKSLLFKVNNPVVKDKGMRDAICNLVNSYNLSSIFGDNTNVSRANSVFGHNNFYKYNDNLVDEMSSGNAIEYIKKYQREHEDSTLKMGFILDPGEPQEKFAVSIQESFINRGIDIELVALYEEEYLEDLKDPNSKVFDFCLYEYDSNDNPDYFKNFFKTDGALNYSGYSNPELDPLWQEAQSEKDFQKRLETYGDIQSIINEDKPVYPLFFANKIVATDDRIINIEEAAANGSSFFTHLNKLDIKEFEASKKDIKKYKIDESSIKRKPKYDDVNIFTKNSQPKKVIKPEGAKEIK